MRPESKHCGQSFTAKTTVTQTQHPSGQCLQKAGVVRQGRCPDPEITPESGVVVIVCWLRRRLRDRDRLIVVVGCLLHIQTVVLLRRVLLVVARGFPIEVLVGLFLRV